MARPRGAEDRAVAEGPVPDAPGRSAAPPGSPGRRGVTFGPPTASAFVSEVKREVGTYFSSRGLSDKATVGMVAKTVVMLALVFGSYGLLITGVATGWAGLAVCVVMGIGIAGTGFGVGHDALHGAYSSRPWVNRAVGSIFEVIGASVPLWKLTHNVIHHTFTNLHGLDEDINPSPILRFSREMPHRAVHRYQRWFCFPLYSLGTLNWIFLKDYRDFFRRKLGPYEDRRRSPRAFLSLALGKAFHYSWTIVLPLVLLDITVWQFLAGFLAMHLTAGLILGTIFQLGHVVEGPDFPTPTVDGSLEDAWVIHQMKTTADFAPRNRLLTWYAGGLNFQIEHHLFPRVCSVHYEAISPIVRECARRHGVPYHVQPTLRSALASHWRLVSRLSLPDAVPASQPAAS
jgi:linoleoyl-CoA desaturase